MLGLPSSTEVNRRVAKEKLYTNANMNIQLRELTKNQIESVVWRNKLAESTLSIAAGETVKEIQVFEFALRQRGIDKRVLSAIAKAIPYKILFILTFENEVQTWIEASGNFYNTDWILLDGFTLRFEGLNLDALYENMIRQISGNRLGTEEDITTAVIRDRQRQKLEREIVALEKKILREKQFNRQFELNIKLKRLQGELEELNK